MLLNLNLEHVGLLLPPKVHTSAPLLLPYSLDISRYLQGG